MAAFPILRTGAIAQYPVTKALTFATRVYRFLDGTEQRYREYAAPVRRWVVRLNLLTDVEVAALDTFYLAQQGGAGTFEFTDPWDGTVYPNCFFDNDTLAFQALDEGRAQANVVIRQGLD